MSVYERLEALNIALPKLTPPLRPAPMFPAIHVDSPSSGSLVERSPDLDLHRKPLAKWSCRVVGAVGIENNTRWSFKDLEEMLRSAKALKRNNEESSGILIGPSMAPRFFRANEFLRGGFFTHFPR